MKKRPMVAINTGDTSLDKVWAHYKDPARYPLTPNQQLVKERWTTAWKLLTKKKFKTKVAKVLEEMYGVSRAQAFRDIRNAEKLYGNALRADRDGQMALLYQFALDGYNKAMKDGEYVAARGFHASMMECLPKEDSLDFNPKKLEYKPVKISAPKLVIDRILKAGNLGVLDFNRVVDGDAIIVSDEEE